MGTPSAVTISNLYLHAIEIKAIRTMLHPPKLYTRYIDDIFAIVPSIEYKNNLLLSLNSQDINIKELAELTNGYSGAQIKSLINEAAIYAARQGKNFINNININDAYEKLSVGINSPAYQKCSQTFVVSQWQWKDGK